MNGKNNVREFGIRDKVGYALGDFGCNMSFAFISSYMMVFFVTCLGMDSKVYALIIFMAKAWDAVNDAIIGRLVDKTKPGKNGKFIPWIRFASLPLIITTVVMFIYMPNASSVAKIILCAASYSIWSVAYTCINVPYGALQSVITSNSLHRTELSNSRSIGAMIAQLPVMVLLPLIVYDDANSPKGHLFIYIVAVMGIVGFVALQMMTRLITERVEYTVQPEKVSYTQTLKAVIHNRPLIALIIASFGYLAFIMTATNTIQYLFMEYFKNTGMIAIASAIVAAPMMLTVLLTKPLSKRFTRKQIVAWPFIVTIACTLLLTLVKFTNPYVWLVIFGVGMMASGFFMILVWAMVADCIDYHEKISGRREEGSIYALYSFFRKLAQGAGAAIVSLAIGFTGYDENLAALKQAQPAGVGDRIYTAVGLLPLIGGIICFVSLMLIYNYNEKEKASDA